MNFVACSYKKQSKNKKGESEMNINLVGIDIAKTVFHAHGIDARGKALLSKKLKRSELRSFVAQLPAKITIAMETCGSAHYWGREFIQMGYKVLLIPAQFVKPYVKSNKNDCKDAEAIAEAAGRPNMRFCEVKSIAQQEIQHMHRIRTRIIKSQTALSNEMRGILAEYGIIISQGKKILHEIPEIMEKTPNQITESGKKLVHSLLDEYWLGDKRLSVLNKEIEALAKAHPVCQRLLTIPGVGPTIASAIVAASPGAHLFKNGRQFSAWLGLVPKQSSSGGKSKLLGISKRGDKYIRQLLVHGARSVLMVADKKKDVVSKWAAKIKKTKGWNKAAVALANKNARIIWALLSNETAQYEARFGEKA